MQVLSRKWKLCNENSCEVILKKKKYHLVVFNVTKKPLSEEGSSWRSILEMNKALQ